MKTIVLHDYFKYMEGGGRLCLILSQGLKTDLGYGFKIEKHPYFDEYPLEGRHFNLNSHSYFSGLRNLSLIKTYINKTIFLKDYNAVIYSGSYAPLAVKNHRDGKNIYYCHTPPRYIYDQRELYDSRIPFIYRPILSKMRRYHKGLYEKAVRKMDLIITNSNNVKHRIQKYLGIKSEVVYPPCETFKYRNLGQQGYYLSAGRLDPLKRVEIIVEAFKRMPDRKLIVISDGPGYNNIKESIAKHSNIILMGRVSETTLRTLMGNCIANIYIPKDEDFGMTPVESMASGKPVIGVNAGGLTETIEHNRTGILLPADPTTEDLIQAINELTPRRARDMMDSCRKISEKFNADNFILKMSQIAMRGSI